MSRAIDHLLCFFDFTSNCYVAHGSIHNEINPGAKQLLQLIQHLEIGLAFGMSPNRSKFDKQINVAFSRSKVIPYCRSKSKQLLDTVPATQLSNGFFVIVEEIVHGSPLWLFYSKQPLQKQGSPMIQRRLDRPDARASRLQSLQSADRHRQCRGSLGDGRRPKWAIKAVRRLVLVMHGQGPDSGTVQPIPPIRRTGPG